jgi:hypothetical protein
LPISEELRQNFLVVRDYKRCLSIFSRLGRLNAKACVVFGDFIVKDRTRQDAMVLDALGTKEESGMETTPPFRKPLDKS